jgi:hypothetical protein
MKNKAKNEKCDNYPSPRVFERALTLFPLSRHIVQKRKEHTA